MTIPDPATSRPTKVRKGRLVLKPSDVDAKELEALRAEVADLRAAHNDLVWALNRHSLWIQQFAVAMGRVLKYAPWRWCAWILPLPIPPYENREDLSYLKLKDAKPDFGGHDEA
jgi:hypothetical protein